MFSRGRVCVVDRDNNEIEGHPFTKLIANPNFSQSQQDFLYQHLFFKATGNNVTRIINKRKSTDLEGVIALKNLVPSQINYKDINKVDKFIFSASDIKAFKEETIIYTISGKEYSIPLNELVFFYDITNGLQDGRVMTSPSRISALEPSLANIYEAQKGKNINLKLSSKHIISGKQSAGGDPFKETILEAAEKTQIEDRLFQKDTHAVGSQLDVHSLAGDFRKLMLDDSLAADMLRVSNAFGMSKDVLNWAMNGASTFENQKTAIVDWIQNSIQFEGDDWANTWTTHFSLEDAGEKVVMKYDHLPVMQILKEKQMQALKTRAEIAELIIKVGGTKDEAFEISGLNDIQGEK